MREKHCVGLSYYYHYLRSNLTVVGLSITIKLDEKLDAIPFKKVTFLYKKTNKMKLPTIL